MESTALFPVPATYLLSGDSNSSLPGTLTITPHGLRCLLCLQQLSFFFIWHGDEAIEKTPLAKFPSARQLLQAPERSFHSKVGKRLSHWSLQEESHWRLGGRFMLPGRMCGAVKLTQISLCLVVREAFLFLCILSLLGLCFNYGFTLPGKCCASEGVQSALS